MKADDLLAALDLPATARVGRRLPKTLLLEHGAPTAGDRRRIQEGIEQAEWVATVEPATIGVAAHRDDARDYLEIAVLRLTLRARARLDRLVELVHRAVPHPVLAVAALGEGASLSLAHKRRSQGEAGKTVLDGDVVASEGPLPGEAHAAGFLAALALGRQPRESLLALYQGWMDTLWALAAARRTGAFEVPADPGRRAARREAVRECERAEAEIARLAAAAAKEKQMARQVELNLELQRARAARAAALARL